MAAHHGAVGAKMAEQGLRLLPGLWLGGFLTRRQTKARERRGRIPRKIDIAPWLLVMTKPRGIGDEYAARTQYGQS